MNQYIGRFERIMNKVDGFFEVFGQIKLLMVVSRYIEIVRNSRFGMV